MVKTNQSLRIYSIDGIIDVCCCCIDALASFDDWSRGTNNKRNRKPTDHYNDLPWTRDWPSYFWTTF